MSGQALTLCTSVLIGWIAMISINLDSINLCQFRCWMAVICFFYAVRSGARKACRPLRFKEWAFRGGLAAVLALMLMVTFNDLASFGLWKNLAGLIGLTWLRQGRAPACGPRNLRLGWNSDSDQVKNSALVPPSCL